MSTAKSLIKASQVFGVIAHTGTTGQTGAAIAPFGVVWGDVIAIHAQSWADSTKAATGADTAVSIKVYDAEGTVLFSTADQSFVSGKTFRVYHDLSAGNTGWSLINEAGTALTGVTGTATVPGGYPIQPGRAPFYPFIFNSGNSTDYWELALYIQPL